MSIRFVDPNSDRWRTVAADSAPGDVPVGAPHLLLTLAQWHAVRDLWPDGTPVGLSVGNDVDVETLADDLPRLAVVALHFPKWTDGRAYSQARLLRSRLAFDGEVRATGEVLVDMLPLLVRTGFDAAVLRADQSDEAARRALSFFPDGYYQGDVGAPWPRFRRTMEAAS